MDHRTQAWRATASIMTASAPEVPLEPRLESRCKVCASCMGNLPNGAAVKNLADQLLCIPWTYTNIVRALEPLMEKWPAESRFSQHSLARHARRHLHWEAAAFREAADRRAADSGQATDRMITASAVFELVRQRGVELLLQDDLRPSVKDVLAATKALHELEQEATEGYSIAELYSQMDRVITIFREELPEDLRDRILSRILDEERSLAARPAEDPSWLGLEAEVEADRP